MITQIGKIHVYDIYHDPMSKKDRFLVGRKDNMPNFIIGGSENIEDYITYIRLLDKSYNREYILEKIGI